MSLICSQSTWSHPPGSSAGPPVIDIKISWLSCAWNHFLQKGPLSHHLPQATVTTEACNFFGGRVVSAQGRISLLGVPVTVFSSSEMLSFPLAFYSVVLHSVLTPTLLCRSCPLLPTYSYSREALSGQGTALETNVADKGGLNLPPSTMGRAEVVPPIHSYRAISSRKQSL